MLKLTSKGTISSNIYLKFDQNYKMTSYTCKLIYLYLEVKLRENSIII